MKYMTSLSVKILFTQHNLIRNIYYLIKALEAHANEYILGKNVTFFINSNYSTLMPVFS